MPVYLLLAPSHRYLVLSHLYYDGLLLSVVKRCADVRVTARNKDQTNIHTTHIPIQASFAICLCVWCIENNNKFLRTLRGLFARLPLFIYLAKWVFARLFCSVLTPFRCCSLFLLRLRYWLAIRNPLNKRFSYQFSQVLSKLDAIWYSHWQITLHSRCVLLHHFNDDYYFCRSFFAFVCARRRNKVSAKFFIY